MRGVKNISIGLVATGLWLLALGFVVFAMNVMRAPSDDLARADGIVVLTGGPNRIEEGARLLSGERAKRMLISGVNTRTSQADLIRISGLSAKIFNCCVDLGYTALDTTGNASETRTWATANRYESLIVVTSNYHMPRSLVELSRELPGTTLIPHAVVPKGFEREAWWLSPVTARNLVAEYVKFLPSAARYALHRAIAPFDHGTLAEVKSAEKPPS